MVAAMQGLRGQLLLAMPTMQDARFRDSVILVCSHDEEGCMGLMVNRPQQIRVDDVLQDLNITLSHPIGQPVYEGGPLDTFRGFVLHDSHYIYDSTMQISESLHLTASRDLLEALGRDEGPSNYLLILGYAGWGGGQLEEELANNDWLIAPASEQLLFHEPPAARWQYAALSIGIERSQLSSQIGHA